jgi:hypothetical protein
MLLLLILTLCGAAIAMPATAMVHWLWPALCYGAGLALTLALAARLTPAAWWHRPTVRGLCIVAGGTWACGSALALAAGLGTPALPNVPDAPGAPAALAAPVPPAAITDELPPFRVHRSLNLRAGPDVGSARLAVIGAGAQLTPTGERSGDWWRVRAGHGGQELTGWVSSLWLRRLAERDNSR